MSSYGFDLDKARSQLVEAARWAAQLVDPTPDAKRGPK